MTTRNHGTGDDFVNHISSLMRAALKRRNITTVAESLGCRCLRTTGGKWVIQELAQPKSSHERFVLESLLGALRSGIVIEGVMVGDTFALLDGLSKKDRWRSCLLNLDDAYALACTLMKFSLQTRLLGYAMDVSTTVAKSMVSTLNTWLRPIVPFDVQPSIETLTSAMFGEAWCHIIDPVQMANGEVILLTQAHRPPFLPGLVAAQSDLPAAHLPELDLT
jgi:hypothetical protein